MNDFQNENENMLSVIQNTTRELNLSVLRQWFSRCYSCMSSDSCTWDFVRNTHAWALLQSHIVEVELSSLFQSTFLVILSHIKCENQCPKISVVCNELMFFLFLSYASRMVPVLYHPWENWENSHFICSNMWFKWGTPQRERFFYCQPP